LRLQGQIRSGLEFAAKLLNRRANRSRTGECQMTNASNRGTAPGRARDASERRGTFKPVTKRIKLITHTVSSSAA
jgi:hypothetical protein